MCAALSWTYWKLREDDKCDECTKNSRCKEGIFTEGTMLCKDGISGINAGARRKRASGCSC